MKANIVSADIIKIGPYNPVINGLSKYESLALLTAGKHDPDIDLVKAKEYLFYLRDKMLKYNIVISSELKRARSTAQFLIDEGMLQKQGVIFFIRFK